MKVKKLIEILKKCDPERIVILSKDEEGNSFSPLSTVQMKNCNYNPITTWYGEVGFEYLTAGDKKAGYNESNIIKGKKAILLWPVN